MPPIRALLGGKTSEAFQIGNVSGRDVVLSLQRAVWCRENTTLVKAGMAEGLLNLVNPQ